MLPVCVHFPSPDLSSLLNPHSEHRVGTAVHNTTKHIGFCNNKYRCTKHLTAACFKSYDLFRGFQNFSPSIHAYCVSQFTDGYATTITTTSRVYRAVQGRHNRQWNRNYTFGLSDCGRRPFHPLEKKEK